MRGTHEECSTKVSFCMLSIGHGLHELRQCVIYFGEGNGNPLQYSCLENPMDRGAWWAAVHGVAKSRARLSDFALTFHFHALEKEMATHSSVLTWRIPGTREPHGLLSMGSHTVGHDGSDLAAAAVIYLVACGIPWHGALPHHCQNFWCHWLEHFLSTCFPMPYMWDEVLHHLLGASQVAQVVRSPLAKVGDAREAHSIPGSGRFPGEENGSPLQYFLPEKFHGQRNLVGYSIWGHKESDMCAHTHTHTDTHYFYLKYCKNVPTGGRGWVVGRGFCCLVTK